MHKILFLICSENFGFLRPLFAVKDRLVADSIKKDLGEGFLVIERKIDKTDDLIANNICVYTCTKW